MRRVIALLCVTAALLPAAAAAVPAPGAVTIYRDPFGVPHIVAPTQRGLAFGAGYALANDRLFETDVIRRLAQGRLSEVIGPGMLEADRVMRREFYDAADIESQLEALPDEVRDLLEGFADGFNQALAEQTADPLEASVVCPALGYVPEPWRPRDFRFRAHALHDGVLRRRG